MKCLALALLSVLIVSCGESEPLDTDTSTKDFLSITRDGRISAQERTYLQNICADLSFHRNFMRSNYTGTLKTLDFLNGGEDCQGTQRAVDNISAKVEDDFNNRIRLISTGRTLHFDQLEHDLYGAISQFCAQRSEFPNRRYVETDNAADFIFIAKGNGSSCGAGDGNYCVSVQTGDKIQTGRFDVKTAREFYLGGQDKGNMRGATIRRTQNNVCPQAEDEAKKFSSIYQSLESKL